MYVCLMGKCAAGERTLHINAVVVVGAEVVVVGTVMTVVTHKCLGQQPATLVITVFRGRPRHIYASPTAVLQPSVQQSAKSAFDGASSSRHARTPQVQMLFA